MIELICPVRGCAKPLERAERMLRCAGGHVFNLSRRGTCTLLQPQDRRSRDPGDARQAVDARRRWIERGHLEGLLAAMRPLLDELDLPPRTVVLDVGCGEAYLSARLATERGWELCGLDLSERALGLAARRLAQATWLRVNADRPLPLATASVDLALSLFGRRPGSELRRILRPTGHLLVAVPGPDDLLELRREVLGVGKSLAGAERVVRELEPVFALGSRRLWHEHVELDRAAIADALAMSYRGARHREAGRAEHLEALTVTLSAELLLFHPVGDRIEHGEPHRPARETTLGAREARRTHGGA